MVKGQCGSQIHGGARRWQQCPRLDLALVLVSPAAGRRDGSLGQGCDELVGGTRCHYTALCMQDCRYGSNMQGLHIVVFDHCCVK
jgi:hypothetical protein